MVKRGHCTSYRDSRGKEGLSWQHEIKGGYWMTHQVYRGQRGQAVELEVEEGKCTSYRDSRGKGGPSCQHEVKDGSWTSH